MENWDGVSDLGEMEILNSSFSSVVNIEEGVAPVNLSTEVKSEPDKMEPCLVDAFLVEEKEVKKSRVPRLDTDSAKVTCEAMAEKVKDEVVAADEEVEENNIRTLANFKSRYVRETQKVKKSLKVIMNKSHW